MASAAQEFGVLHLAEVERNEYGTPLVSSIFRLAREHAEHALLCYVNGDILLLDDFLPAVARLHDRFERFLMVGQRWDLDVEERLSFLGSWEAGFRRRVEVEGRLHPPSGSDYFVYHRSMFDQMPPFALGRPSWDNWMIFSGRMQGVPVVDATEAATVVHQNHDYGHLPGGRPHYGSAEHMTNRQLGGGKRRMFTLRDCDWRLTAESIERATPSWRRLLRSLETWPMIDPRFGWLEGPIFALLHPLLFARTKLGEMRRGT